MTLPKRSSRVICVGDIYYRWVSKFQSPRHIIAIEASEDPGQRLRIVFEEDRVITPKVVAYVIRTALEQGWEPRKSKLPDLQLDGDELVAGTEFELNHPPNCNWPH